LENGFPMTKAFRQGQILQLIERKAVGTQEELARGLAELGISTTQATLSRDIQELRLAKTPEGYQRLNGSPAGRTFAAAAQEYLRDARLAQNMLVLKTPPGNANALAVALDREDRPEVVGTIAGDDTVLVILPDATAASEMHEQLMEYLK
jgi:transcriptional regulator of arginine metabolism